jgi:hypothetical protein
MERRRTGRARRLVDSLSKMQGIISFGAEVVAVHLRERETERDVREGVAEKKARFSGQLFKMSARPLSMTSREALHVAIGSDRRATLLVLCRSCAC